MSDDKAARECPPSAAGRGRAAALLALCASLFALACAPRTATREPASAAAASPPASEPAADAFDEYLRADFAPADGFDFPVGDAEGRGPYTDRATGRRHEGWYVATRFAETYSLGVHPGEDWNGAGGGDTDLGQDVFAVAHGRVVFAGDCGRLWGNVLVIEHVFYENHERKKLRSLYAHLQSIGVRVGEEVRRRQRVAAVGQDPDKLYPAHLHLELRWNETLGPTYWPTSDGKDVAWVRENYAEPSAFIKSHRRLPVPQREPVLLIVRQQSYKMRLYREGRMQGEYEVSFGQERGRKRLRGDNRTPQGMYFVTHKHRGRFDGPYGAYYGGHWVKINYPNKFDAAWGRAEGLLTPREEAAVSANWERRQPTLETTRLGGGIGFHGWIREWDNEGPRHLSWGCVVLHLYDIEKLFDQMPPGTMVVIF